ncbi:MAG: amidohydrolase [Chloroflexi bacterium]|nr:amidohydrolase [Chloroflexota bacterium]
MVIDCHGHITAPAGLQGYHAGLIAGRSRRGGEKLKFSDEQITYGIEHSRWGNAFELLSRVGTDMQFISIRPFTAGMYLKPYSIVRDYITAVNDTIAHNVRLYPKQYRGVISLPQAPGLPADEWIGEIDRFVDNPGIVGVTINPDPGEMGDDSTPGLGEKYWYPLYEKMVQHDLPALIHGASCGLSRLSYSTHFINEETIAVTNLLDSNVFNDFPNLKIIVSHGGGAVPYQYARWAAGWARRWGGRFGEALRKLYYDSCVYSKEGLQCLLSVVGPDNVLFGTENPGTGNQVNPDTGRTLEDIAPIIRDILGERDAQKVLETNARRLFSRYKDEI